MEKSVSKLSIENKIKEEYKRNRQYLLNISWYALPSKPTSMGYSSVDIKRKAYEPLIQLYDWLYEVKEVTLKNELDIALKQDKLMPGLNIEIKGNVISAIIPNTLLSINTKGQNGGILENLAEFSNDIVLILDFHDKTLYSRCPSDLKEIAVFTSSIPINEDGAIKKTLKINLIDKTFNLDIKRIIEINTNEKINNVNSIIVSSGTNLIKDSKIILNTSNILTLKNNEISTNNIIKTYIDNNLSLKQNRLIPDETIIIDENNNIKSNVRGLIKTENTYLNEGDFIFMEAI